MKTVELYTDGACSKNPGPGGWAAVLIYNGIKKEVCGYYKDGKRDRHGTWRKGRWGPAWRPVR